MALSAVPAASATPTVAAALLSLAGGSAAVLLFFFALASAGDLAGVGVPGLAAALDPARPGSLPELWGLAWLTASAGLALAAALRARDMPHLRLALLPLILGLVEVIDLTARLEAPAGALIGAASGTSAAKLAADALVSGLVLAAAAGAAAGGLVAGRRCLLAILLVGGADVACDLAGRFSAELLALPTVSPVWETVEETFELALYLFIAAIVVAATLRLLTNGLSHNRTF